MRPISARSRRPMIVRRIHPVEKLAGFIGREHRRLAAPSTVPRTAHGGRRIRRNDLTEHQELKHHPNRGKGLFDAWPCKLLLQLLDVRCDVNRADAIKFQTSLLAKGKKITHGTMVRPMRQCAAVLDSAADASSYSPATAARRTSKKAATSTRLG